MGEAHRSGAGRADGSARPQDSSYNGSAVLTPPTGIPVVGDLESLIPAPRPSQDGPVSTPAPPQAPVGTQLCTCGHPAQMHEHYRDGDDCGFCGPAACSSFRVRDDADDAGSPLRRALRRLRR